MPKPISVRLKELKQAEKRIQENLLKEIALMVIRNYNPETRTINTRELVSLISENYDFLRKYQKTRKEQSNENVKKADRDGV